MRGNNFGSPTCFHVVRQCRFMEGDELASLHFANKIAWFWATLFLVVGQRCLVLADKLAAICFSACKIDGHGFSPVTHPLAWGFLEVVQFHRYVGHRLCHCLQHPVIKRLVLAELFNLHMQHNRKLTVVLHATQDSEAVPFFFQLLKLRRICSQQDFDVGRREECVREETQTFGRKKQFQRGTVLSFAFVVDSTIGRAPVPDKPMHTTCGQ